MEIVNLSGDSAENTTENVTGNVTGEASVEAPEETTRFITLLKVGGNELDDSVFLEGFTKAVQSILDSGHFPVIVHGGGKTIAGYQERLGMEPSFLEGLRITDEASLDVAEMVLSGLMNKRIVRALVNAGIRAAGISGVDDGTIYVEPMWHPMGDLGRVGDIQDVDTHLIQTLVSADIVPVISPISFGATDALSYNVNADHAATAISVAMKATKLIFVSNVSGVMVAGQVARAISAGQAEGWIEEGVIFGGMIPKVRSAIEAVQSGVPQAIITNLAGIQEGNGTAIIGSA